MPVLTCLNKLRTFGNILRQGKSIVNMTKKQNFTSSKGNQKKNDPNKTLNLKMQSASKVNGKFEVLPCPVQSDSDKKEYKIIRLNNGLTACLISDKSPIESADSDNEMDTDEESSEGESEYESDDKMSVSEGEESEEGKDNHEQKLAAAALCIGVGSFSDPKEVPGMAHFLEHMVFMGSKKFPEENDFDAFIKKRGGSDNAATDTETTCFYFECMEKDLFEALDKFAQFFISPLMKESAIQREREAIESEFQMSLPSDSSRKEQLLCSFAKQDSPVNSFSWGNLKTLKDNIADDKLYKGVHEFRKRHYSAHRMTLAIQGRLPMETLQDYVLKCFKGVPNNNQPPLDYSSHVNNVFDTPAFRKMYYVKPVKDLCQVDLTWALPTLLDKYKSKPQQYIANLLGHEGKGSLLSYLRKKVWVLGNSVGNSESGSEHNSLYALFTVSMVLTDEGVKHLNEVIEAVFSYINMLKEGGPQKRIYDEVKLISDTSFRFLTEDTASDYVEELCESMHFYPPEHYICGSDCYFEYDPEGIKSILNDLKPDNMNIMILCNKLPENIQYDKVEEWFGTKYTEREIPKDQITKWANVKPYPELCLPEPNIYLTTDFSILPEKCDNPEYPQKLSDSPLYELWFKQDQKFKLPRAHYNLYLISPYSMKSVKHMTMIDMLHNFLEISTSEELYSAKVAEFTYRFSSYEKGLIIKVAGFNEKMPVLITVISKYLKQISDLLQEDMFLAVKKKLIDSYYNKLLKPSALAKDVRFELLLNQYGTSSERYESLKSVTFEEMKLFSKDFFKNLLVKVLVQGNVSEECAKSTIEKFVIDLGYEKLPENAYPEYRVAQIPLGEVCCRVEAFNKNDSNSVITNYYQSEVFTLKNNCILELLMLIIEEPLFDILRTKEQLGYHVTATLRDTFGILGHTITVHSQATKFTTQHVESRIEEFVKSIQKLLAEMDLKELESMKKTLIKVKQSVDVELKEEVDRNWSEITADDYLFDRIKQEVNIINGLTLDEIRKWWDEHNLCGNKEKFRKFSIQVVGHDIKASADQEVKNEAAGDNAASVNVKLVYLGSQDAAKTENKPAGYFIENIKNFKSNLTIYPPIKIK